MTKQPESFAARLHRLREEAGLSVADLADRAGITRQYLYVLEQGTKQPSLEVARDLAEALGHKLRVWE